MKNKMYFLILSLWEKSKDFSLLSFHEKIIFFVLSFLEYFYILGFFLVTKVKVLRGGHKAPFKVISVGNLSVGGTGKSPFVAFLVDRLSLLRGNNSTHVNAHKANKEFAQQTIGLRGAILLRGYKKKSSGSVLLYKDSVPDDAAVVGDEALMLVKKLGVPVVVGKSRVRSVQLLADFCREQDVHIDYLILDDAYQNFQLKKDCEILLLDARKPFENGHCLPAGRLREKDYSRADVIALTHADKAKEGAVSLLKKRLAKTFPIHKIFTGRHGVVGLRVATLPCDKGGSLEPCNRGPLMRVVPNKKMLIVAGIGSFSGFVDSVRQVGIVIGGHAEYPDHHPYTLQDVAQMCEQMRLSQCQGIVTTEKDWQKLRLLVGQQADKFYILEIAFEFLSPKEESDFFDVIERKFAWR